MPVFYRLKGMAQSEEESVCRGGVGCRKMCVDVYHSSP